MIVAATGHRPDKLGGYGQDVHLRLVRGAKNWLAGRLPEPPIVPVSLGISGMALGWDQAFAMGCVESGIPFIAAIPFEGQERKWPAESQKRYAYLLKLAQRVEIVSPGGYDPAKMQVRNAWMVDNCDAVLALWDGTAGGTANCVRYAQAVERPVINLWSLWKRRK